MKDWNRKFIFNICKSITCLYYNSIAIKQLFFFRSSDKFVIIFIKWKPKFLTKLLSFSTTILQIYRICQLLIFRVYKAIFEKLELHFFFNRNDSFTIFAKKLILDWYSLNYTLVGPNKIDFIDTQCISNIVIYTIRELYVYTNWC